MAAQVVPAGGGGGPPFAIGSFIIVSRGAEWDEVWIAGYTNSGEAIVRTTDDSGGDWIWALVKLVPLQVKAPTVSADGSRAWGGVQLDLHSSRLRSCLDSRCGGDRFLDPGSQFDWTALCFSPSKFGREHSWFSCSSGACGDRRCRSTRPWRSRNGCWRRFARGCRAGARRRRRCESISGRDQGFGGGSSAVAESCSWGQEGQVQEEKGQPRFSQTSQALQGSQEEKVKEVQEVQKVIKLNLFELLNQSFQEPFFEHQFQEPEVLGLEGIGEGQGGELHRLESCGAAQAEEEGGSHQFCSSSSWGIDCALPCGGVCPPFQGHHFSYIPVIREVSVASWAHQFSGLTEVRDVKEVLTLAEILDHVNRKEIARALDVLCQRILKKAKEGAGTRQRPWSWSTRRRRWHHHRCWH